jgi:parallel beta-helix repeat protein
MNVTQCLTPCFLAVVVSAASCRTGPQETIIVEATDWSAVSHVQYEWYDSIHLPTLRAWVSRVEPFDGTDWDAAPPTGLTRHYPIVVRDESGSFRPSGPGFYPREEYQHASEQVLIPGWGELSVIRPLVPDEGNWIDDPGAFSRAYAARAPGWGAPPGELWRFVHPYSLYGMYAQEADRGFLSPEEILDPVDLEKFLDYAKKRERLERLRTAFFATMREAFDGFDYQRLRDALQNAPSGSTAEIRGDLYLHRALWSATKAEFLTWRPLDRVDWEFSGTLTGRNGATISTLPNATFEWNYGENGAVMMLFGYERLGGPPAAITISNLMINVTEPGRTWFHHGIPANILTAIQIQSQDRTIDIAVHDVRVMGVANTDWFHSGGNPVGRSVYVGFVAAGIRDARVSFSRNHVENSVIGIWNHRHANTVVTVGGSNESGVRFEGNSVGVYLTALAASQVKITHNKTRDAPLVFLPARRPEEASYAPSNFKVSDNHVHLDEGVFSAFGIVGSQTNDGNSSIERNQITGRDYRGVRLVDASGWTIRENTIEGASIGIILEGGSSGNSIELNHVVRGGHGIQLPMGLSGNSIRGNMLAENAVGMSFPFAPAGEDVEHLATAVDGNTVQRNACGFMGLSSSVAAAILKANELGDNDADICDG